MDSPSQAGSGRPTLQPSLPTFNLPIGLLLLPFPPEGPATTRVVRRKEEAASEEISATNLYSFREQKYS